MEIDLLSPDMIATGIGTYHGEETYPRIEVLVYDRECDLGDSSDGRIKDEGFFETFEGKSIGVRIATPVSQLGVLVKEGKLDYAETGMRGLVGKQATILRNVPAPRDAILIVWRDKDKWDTMPPREKDVERHRLVSKLRGLQMVFH